MSDHTYRVAPYFREENRFTLYAARCVCGWKSADPPPTLGPVMAGSPPKLTITLPADRITVEHELRRGPRATVDE